jgi:hypothetical protein
MTRPHRLATLMQRFLKFCIRLLRKRGMSPDQQNKTYRNYARNAL